jgi:hypothetical protein
MNNLRIAGLVVAAFVAGSFIASSELRAYAANTIRSIDIVDGQVLTADLGANAVTGAKIKDGEVRAAEIATDGVGPSEIAANAVGASEIATNAVGAAEIASFAVGAEELAADSVGASELEGVTELDYTRCVFQFGGFEEDIVKGHVCNVAGVDSDDIIIGTLNDVSPCFQLNSIKYFQDGQVIVYLTNECAGSPSAPGGSIGLIVFDKVVDSKT